LKGVGATPQVEKEEQPPARNRRFGKRVAIADGVTCVSVIALLLAFHFSPGAREAPDIPLRVHPFTSYPGFEDTPSFSPDEARIAFARRRPGAKQSDICIQTTEGSQFVEIAATSGDEFSPAWSPDGSMIAHLRRGAHPYIDLMIVPPIPGAPPRRIGGISYPPSMDPTPYYHGNLLSWSADSKFIYVPHAGSGAKTAIWWVET
jgi:hypothetical protein